MKIVIISTSVFKIPLVGYGGLESIAYECAKGLAAKGHDVALIAPEGSTCPGVTIIPTGLPGTWDEKSTYGGWPEHKEGEVVKRKAFQGYWSELLNYDVVVDHGWQKHSYLLKMEGRLKAPILGVMHAPVNTMYKELPPIEKPCFVCISKDQASHFEALHNRPARVCHNGVDTDFYKPLNVPRTDRFLFLARFSSVKSPDIAIEACKAAGVGLDLIGDTSITNEPELLQRCQQMADGKQIRIVGPCSRGEAVWWMSQAYAFLHPCAHFREPFGLAPVEAQLCGLPVVTWNNGAMRETVSPGATGLLARSVEELTGHIKCEWMKNIIQNDRDGCREWAMQFSVERMVQRYEELCVEALDGGW